MSSNRSIRDEEEDDEVKEQDRFLPIANISRIMKKSLPPNAKIAKEAKECVQECVSEFISFITSEASDKCKQEKRKTINGDDLLWAMSTLGFDKYVEPLKLYLQKYRESMKGDKPDKLSAKKIHHSTNSRSYNTATGTHHYSTAGMAANHFSTKATAASSTSMNTSYHHQQNRLSAIPAPNHTTTTGISNIITAATNVAANTSTTTSAGTHQQQYGTQYQQYGGQQQQQQQQQQQYRPRPMAGHQLARPASELARPASELLVHNLSAATTTTTTTTVASTSQAIPSYSSHGTVMPLAHTLVAPRHSVEAAAAVHKQPPPTVQTTTGAVYSTNRPLKASDLVMTAAKAAELKHNRMNNAQHHMIIGAPMTAATSPTTTTTTTTTATSAVTQAPVYVATQAPSYYAPNSNSPTIDLTMSNNRI